MARAFPPAVAVRSHARVASAYTVRLSSDPRGSCLPGCTSTGDGVVLPCPDGGDACARAFSTRPEAAAAPELCGRETPAAEEKAEREPGAIMPRIFRLSG